MIVHYKDEIRIKLFIKYLISKKTNTFEKYDNGQLNIVVALAADYGNLGDVAITYAQTKFLKKEFPRANVIDFPIGQTFTQMKSLKGIIKKEDIITIVGGGNTSDMYDDIEYSRQFIIKNFPENKIISFPQTIDFSASISGQRALKRAITVYSKHKYLCLSAREEKSYKQFKRLFPHNKVIFAPDIVLSLDESSSQDKREGITFILRDDGEKNISKLFQKELIERVSANNPIRLSDTHIDKVYLTVKERENELATMWELFRNSEMVITDRLHGMIFAAITKTPCIAMDNSNKKVSGVKDAWLQEIPTIKVIENESIEETLQLIEDIKNQFHNKACNVIDRKEFNNLLELLEE